jgi:hypothetical protein
VELLLYIPFAIRNYIRAVAIKLSGWLWAFYTVLAMMIASVLGAALEVFIIMNNNRAFAAAFAKRSGTFEEAMMAEQKAVEGLPRREYVMLVFFAIFGAIGGYLFVRHLLISRAGREAPKA